MKEFTISEEGLVWSFLDELNISLFEIIKHEVLLLGKDFNEAIYWEGQKYDQICDTVETNLRSDIISLSNSDFEQNEATGCWGYYNFELDIEEEHSYFSKRVSEVIKTMI